MKIEKLGINMVIKDEGRKASYSSGLNRSNAQDIMALKLLNLVLGNEPLEAAFEFNFPGPKIIFSENGVLALSGADFGAKLNQKSLLIQKAYSFFKGDILTFEKPYSGNFAYLGFFGGLLMPSIAFSKSTINSLGFNTLVLGQEININITEKLPYCMGIALTRKSTKNISFVPSDFFLSFPESVRDTYKNEAFYISKASDGMAFRLKQNKPLIIKYENEDSVYVEPGTIQLLPSGELLVLMGDAQITGGYPVLGYINTVSLSVLSQYAFEKPLFLEMINHEIDEGLLKNEEMNLSQIKKNLDLWS